MLLFYINKIHVNTIDKGDFVQNKYKLFSIVKDINLTHFNFRKEENIFS